MTEDGKGADRVTFSRGYDVCIMAIDGTWRRDCQLNAISDTDAELTVEGSIQGLNLKEFFLLLSSTGLAYRRCELVRVNGTEMDIRFLERQARQEAAERRRRTKTRCTEAIAETRRPARSARWNSWNCRATFAARDRRFDQRRLFSTRSSRRVRSHRTAGVIPVMRCSCDAPA